MPTSATQYWRRWLCHQTSSNRAPAHTIPNWYRSCWHRSCGMRWTCRLFLQCSSRCATAEFALWPYPDFPRRPLHVPPQRPVPYMRIFFSPSILHENIILNQAHHHLFRPPFRKLSALLHDELPHCTRKEYAFSIHLVGRLTPAWSTVVPACGKPSARTFAVNAFFSAQYFCTWNRALYFSTQVRYLTSTCSMRRFSTLRTRSSKSRFLCHKPERPHLCRSNRFSSSMLRYSRYIFFQILNDHTFFQCDFVRLHRKDESSHLSEVRRLDVYSFWIRASILSVNDLYSAAFLHNPLYSSTNLPFLLQPDCHITVCRNFFPQASMLISWLSKSLLAWTIHLRVCQLRLSSRQDVSAAATSSSVGICPVSLAGAGWWREPHGTRMIFLQLLCQDGGLSAGSRLFVRS